MRLRILIAFLFCGTLCPAAGTFRNTAELEQARPEEGAKAVSENDFLGIKPLIVQPE